MLHFLCAWKVVNLFEHGNHQAWVLGVYTVLQEYDICIWSENILLSCKNICDCTAFLVWRVQDPKLLSW